MIHVLKHVESITQHRDPFMAVELHLLEHLKRYKRTIHLKTNEPGAPLHDEHSHGGDVFRYLAIVADQLNNDSWGSSEPLNYQSIGIV